MGTRGVPHWYFPCTRGSSVLEPCSRPPNPTPNQTSLLPGLFILPFLIPDCAFTPLVTIGRSRKATTVASPGDGYDSGSGYESCDSDTATSDRLSDTYAAEIAQMNGEDPLDDREEPFMKPTPRVGSINGFRPAVAATKKSNSASCTSIQTAASVLLVLHFTCSACSVYQASSH